MPLKSLTIRFLTWLNSRHLKRMTVRLSGEVLATGLVYLLCERYALRSLFIADYLELVASAPRGIGFGYAIKFMDNYESAGEAEKAQIAVMGAEAHARAGSEGRMSPLSARLSASISLQLVRGQLFPSTRGAVLCSLAPLLDKAIPHMQKQYARALMHLPGDVEMREWAGLEKDLIQSSLTCVTDSDLEFPLGDLPPWLRDGVMR